MVSGIGDNDTCDPSSHVAASRDAETQDELAQGSLVRGRLVSGKPNPVDSYVGSRLRDRRVALGMSQGRVGEALGLTFQQIQKYERGANRISASRLWDLSGVLECPVGFFFDEMDVAISGESPRKLAQKRSGVEAQGSQRSLHPTTLELVKAYYQIPEARVRRRIFELARTIAVAEEAMPDTSTR